MSMSVAAAWRQLAKLMIVIAFILLAVGLIDSAFAQDGPFGGLRPQNAPVPVGGIAGWLLAKQAEFYRQFSGLIRAAKADGSAAWSLLGLSFLYGIFHAAGPGHGKAVISSYVVANEETWVRGVVLSFASALLQAIVAVTVVGVAAAMLNTSAPTMNSAVNVIESASYGLIVLIGARLLWVKGRCFITALRAINDPVGEVGAAVKSRHHRHDHVHNDQAQFNDSRHSDHRHHHHDHGEAPGHHEHDDASAWGHAHAPEPEDLAGPGGWQRGLSAIIAVGLRPCSGAILVLVFALAQGLFWVGVESTFMMGLGTFITVATIATMAVGARTFANRLATMRPGFGTLALRGIEVAAAVLITAFGGLLLGGYVVNERMIGF
jgi:nickel/cobalt transporter (NicO) family protein